MAPFFSIIIPVYNVEPYLRECLDSVFGQTFTDWEAICVDDGSTDNSGAILDEYAAKDNRFKVIHQKNSGVSAARNVALDKMKGAWVCFIDSDDVISSKMLQLIVDVTCANPKAEAICFGMATFNEGDDCENLFTVATEVRFVDISNKLTIEILYTYFCQFSYKSELFNKRRFKRYIRGEDRVFLADILLQSINAFTVMNAVLYGYRQRSSSAVHITPTTQVIIDEMDHRLDLVSMIENGHKRVDYSGSGWLEGYFTKWVGELIMAKPRDDRRRLWQEWYRCVKSMQCAKGLSRRTRLIYGICCTFPCSPVWWLFCRAWPWYTTHGIIPRACKKIMRLARAC